MSATQPLPLGRETRDDRNLGGWPRWLWALLGGAIGLFDYGILLALDADTTILGRDATIAMGFFFFVPYTLLGWAVGGLARAQRHSERDRATIEGQLRALERTQRALVQEEKLAGIGRLAAGVAHEVRNPLGVIRASASMAREHFESETDAHRALGFVCEETDRLDRLITSLLAFARPQPLECVATELPKVFDRVLELARSDAREASIDLEVELAAGLPSVQADPDRLTQALAGLVTNAVQAIAGAASGRSHDDRTPHTRRILLRASEVDDLIRLEVQDSGPGVPSALRDQIFEPFVTSKQTGTGLGLPMALRMVEAQGGVLRLVDPDEPLASAPALGGAHFVIELPTRSATTR